MLKPNEECLITCKQNHYDELRKNEATNEKYMLRKMILKFESPKFSIYGKQQFLFFSLKNLNCFGNKGF